MAAVKFELEVELSNAAMQTAEDVKEAIVESINGWGRDGTGTLSTLFLYDERGIRDVNGNRVGRWVVVE